MIDISDLLVVADAKERDSNTFTSKIYGVAKTRAKAKGWGEMKAAKAVREAYAASRAFWVGVHVK